VNDSLTAMAEDLVALARARKNCTRRSCLIYTCLLRNWPLQNRLRMICLGARSPNSKQSRLYSAHATHKTTTAPGASKNPATAACVPPTPRSTRPWQARRAGGAVAHEGAVLRTRRLRDGGRRTGALKLPTLRPASGLLRRRITERSERDAVARGAMADAIAALKRINLVRFLAFFRRCLTDSSRDFS